jgi:hypothetical protein
VLHPISPYLALAYTHPSLFLLPPALLVPRHRQNFTSNAQIRRKTRGGGRNEAHWALDAALRLLRYTLEKLPGRFRPSMPILIRQIGQLFHNFTEGPTKLIGVDR